MTIPRVHLLRTMAADAYRRLDSAIITLKATGARSDSDRERDVAMALTDLDVAMMSLQAMRLAMESPGPTPFAWTPAEQAAREIGLAATLVDRSQAIP